VLGKPIWREREREKITNNNNDDNARCDGMIHEQNSKAPFLFPKINHPLVGLSVGGREERRGGRDTLDRRETEEVFSELSSWEDKAIS